MRAAPRKSNRGYALSNEQNRSYRTSTKESVATLEEGTCKKYVPTYENILIV